MERLEKAVRRSPITALLGPGSVAKPHWRVFLRRKATYFDLESQPDLQRLQNPELVLGRLQDFGNSG